MRGPRILKTFARHLHNLAEDPVPNIRFNCAKCIANFYQNFDAEDKQKTRDVLRRISENDSDFDAKYYAQRTLEEISGRGQHGQEQ